jgi:hypothetical protein
MSSVSDTPASMGGPQNVGVCRDTSAMDVHVSTTQEAAAPCIAPT